MAYKFPWTNYHELNLDWILNTVKELFSKTEQNNAIVEQYDGRLTEVELTADNAQTAAEQAQQNSTAALDLAQGAQTTATQAQQAAGQAQQAAGQAQTAAGQAQEAAATAQQTATQAQQTAQNFDGRITQAENNAASALQAAQAFDEQVQGAITAANNANKAATAALTTSAETARELAAQRDTLESIVSDGVDSLQEAAQDATTEIETVGQSVLNSIPADYTALSELVDRKADVIYNTAEGEIASFNDGADDMPIKSLIVNIEPVQSGSGDPSPDNVRPISGHTGAEIGHVGNTICHISEFVQGSLSGTGSPTGSTIRLRSPIFEVNPNSDYSFEVSEGFYVFEVHEYNASQGFIKYTTVNAETGTVKTDAATKYIRWLIRKPNNSIITTGEVFAAVCVPGNTTNLHQISVNWEDEAGTVYGGTLTLNPDRTGTLVVDRAMVDMGTLDWLFSTYDSYNRFHARLLQMIQTGWESDVLASIFQQSKTPVGGTPRIDESICRYNGNLYVLSNSASTAEEFKTLVTGQTAVFPLANPVTYQLTASEISDILSTLYGTNNIWSDTGDTEVTYPADTKLYIDGKIAELQALILEH